MKNHSNKICKKELCNSIVEKKFYKVKENFVIEENNEQLNVNKETIIFINQ